MASLSFSFSFSSISIFFLNIIISIIYMYTHVSTLGHKRIRFLSLLSSQRSSQIFWFKHVGFLNPIIVSMQVEIWIEGGEGVGRTPTRKEKKKKMKISPYKKIKYWIVTSHWNMVWCVDTPAPYVSFSLLSFPWCWKVEERDFHVNQWPPCPFKYAHCLWPWFFPCNHFSYSSLVFFSSIDVSSCHPFPTPLFVPHFELNPIYYYFKRKIFSIIPFFSSS